MGTNIVQSWVGKLLGALAAVAVLLLGGAGLVAACWVSDGPYGGLSPKALAVDPQTPTTVYAALASGVIKSTDGGASWSPMNTGLTCRPLSSCNVSALAVDPKTPTTLYAGQMSDGVFKTTDGGAHWSAVNTGLPQCYDNYLKTTYTCGASALAVDPKTPTTLYAGMEGGVFKTTDGGAHWSAVNTGLVCTLTCNVTALAVDPQTPATLYLWAASSGVFKSTDGGASWSAINSGLTTCGSSTCTVVALALAPQSPTTLYAGTDGGVFKSTDGGASWSAMNTGRVCADYTCGVTALALDPKTPTTLYAGGGGIHKSTDGGAHWYLANTGTRSLPVNALAVEPQSPTTLYGGTYVGVFKSTDGGASWSPVNTGLTCGSGTCAVLALTLVPQSPTTLYAGTWGGGVFKSTDGGASWSPVNTGLTDGNVSALALVPQIPTTLYAGTSLGIFKTTDGGGSWSAMNTGLTCRSGNLCDVRALGLDPQTPTTLYAGASTDGVFKTTDGGGHWSTVNTGLPQCGDWSTTYTCGAFALALDPQTPSTLYAVVGGSVSKSTDGGAHWSIVSSGSVANISAFALDPQTPSTLYAGTLGGVFKSTDGGASWSAVNTAGLTCADQICGVSAIALDPGTPSTFYAGTGEGVFKWTSLCTLTVGKAGDGDGTVSSNPLGIQCGSDCRSNYAVGTPVALTATPSALSSFIQWSGDCTGLDACVVTMDQPRTVTATFSLSPPSYILSVTVAGSCAGSVTINPGAIGCAGTCSASFMSGTVVTLMASAETGGVFREWRGACSGKGSCQVTMNAAKAVTAVFSKTFTDATLTAHATLVRAVHFTDLRAAITTLRSHYPTLGVFSWTDATLVPQSTPVKRAHLTDLRTALDEVYTKAGAAHSPYTDPSPVAGQTIIKAAHLSELRSAVRKLECGGPPCASPDP